MLGGRIKTQCDVKIKEFLKIQKNLKNLCRIAIK